ncbi:MAG: TonB-dependent receptor [Bacteroidales bacterium]|nr:TonB-dependent receptor [Bacteroidales bacterium]
MKTRLLFLLALASASTAVAVGEPRIVKGRVLSDTDGEPMIGVAVSERGTTNGTITDADGNFSINIEEGAVLSISYMGYTTQNVKPVGNAPIKIELVEDSKMLDDVVVVGYGTMKKSDISGSVATINKEQMDRKIPTNIAQALQGAAAGVMVTAQDGAPGTASAIRIRGIGTIHGSSNPLYVVDGVQVGENADFVNPADIESMEVLKDASATAIYGSAGANGVIMITTKHGNKGKMNINITADWGFQNLPYEIETLTGDAYAESIRQARANDSQSLGNTVFSAAYDGRRNNINWQDQMTRMGMKQQYGISASGGNEKTQYNFSVGYLDNKGIIVNTRYNRITSRASVKSKVNKYIEFGGDMNYSRTTLKGNNIGLGNNGNLSSHRDLAQMAPTLDYIDDVTGQLVNVNVVNPDGSYGGGKAPTPNGWEGMSASYANPYATQKEIGRETVHNRISVSPYVDLTLFKNDQHSVNVHSIFNWTQDSEAADEFGGKFKRYNYINGVLTEVKYEGRNQDYYQYDLSQSQSTSKSVETYMTYKWETDFNTLTAMVGNSVSSYEGTWVSAGAHDFLSRDHRLLSLTQDEDSRTGNGGKNADVRGISYYGRIIYSLFDRYILTATIRKDGSSNFGAGNRWGTFPSAALAWRIKEESFLQDYDWLDNAKIRLGWGQTGNPGGLAGKSTYALSSANTKYQFYTAGQGGGATEHIVANRVTGIYAPLVDLNLKWETNEQTNIGVDLGFLGNDLNITMDYFVRNTKDLLIDMQIRPSAGEKSIYSNYGEIQNKGFEFSINYGKQLTKDWHINAAFNASTLKNEVKKMGSPYTSTCGGSNSTYSAYDTNADGSNVGAVDGNGFEWNNHSICQEGEAVGSYYGWRVDKIIRTDEDLAKAKSQGQDKAKKGDYLFKDLNNDNAIDDKDRTIIGNGLPKFNFGLNISATYKDWDFSIYTYGVLGMDILSYSAMRYAIIKQSDDGCTPALLKSSYEKIYSETNPNGSLPRLTLLDDNKNSRISDAWIKNGNFLKINNIQVGYSVPKKVLRPLGVQAVRAYAAIQNILTISPYHKYGDPEVGQGDVLYTGLDTGRYPTPRTYMCGLSVTF